MSLNENVIFTANNADDLLLALKKNKPNIIIKGDYKNEVKKLADSTLSETELMGFDLGSAGTGRILAEIFYQIANLFSNEPKEQKKIESQLRKYTMKITDDNEVLLYLRQQDY